MHRSTSMELLECPRCGKWELVLVWCARKSTFVCKDCHKFVTTLFSPLDEPDLVRAAINKAKGESD